jgi:hypothetical protein
VSVTSPSNGATVSGTITLAASASDNVGVVGVQFFVDGAPRGAEDTSAPYSVNWDTTTAANGVHSITARARDAAGNSRTSSAVSVTVSNGPPPDTTRPSVTLTSPAAGATVSGTVAVTASASDNVGVAGVRFFLDGSALGAEDTTAPYSVSWDTTTAANGVHTLSARARDAAGNTADTTPITVTVSNTAPGTVTRVQQTDPSVTYAGSWTQGDTSFAWSGGTAAFSRGGAGTRATLTFNGTKVSWIGWREARGGMARVLLDGALVAEVDLYAPAAEISVPVFTSATLPEGPHTLVVEATGAKNAAATDSIVVIDAFDVTGTASPPPPPAAGRYQETDPAIAYAGAWFEETTFAWTDGRAMFAVNEGSATFTFTGTGVSWIGYRGHYGGIVRVFIDGAQVAEIDTYTPGDQAGVPVYTATGLAPGTHAIRIELTPMKNPAADASETAIDAFDVTN